MRILVLGKNGQLAKSLKYQTNLKAKYISSKEIDFDKPQEVSKCLEQYHPDVIINCAAYTNVPKAETNEKSAFNINFHSVRELAKYCAIRNIHLVHISTELVFDGRLERSYLESDKTNPLNVYGRSKAFGEQAIMKICKNYSIIRTSWLYSNYGENFLKKIYRNILNQKKIFGVTDRIGNPTSAFDLARVINKHILLLGKMNINGIFHYAGETAVSRYDLIATIAQVMKEKSIVSNVKLEKINSLEFSDGVIRPPQALLNCNKIVKLLNIRQNQLKVSIEEVIEAIV